MFFRGIIAALALSAVGCGPTAVKRACVGGSGGDSSLVTDAAVVRLDVYDATSARCQDGMLAPGAPLPSLTRTYVKGASITLDVPPGNHVLVLTTYADDAATVVLGVGCTAADLSAGAQLCFDLTLVPGPDAGVDLSACGADNPACQCMTDVDCTDPSLPRCSSAGHCVACLPQNDNCSLNHYCDSSTNTCASGCKSNAECAQLAGADGGGVPPGDVICDSERHVCVECAGNGDCPANKLCSSAGTCVPGCDVQAGKLCPGSLTCCNKLCIDTTSDPFNCNGCGNLCTGGATLCCSSSCVNPLTDANHCGSCTRACSSTGVNVKSCAGGVCNSSCTGTLGNCSQPAAPTADDGCESNLATDATHCGSCTRACSSAGVNVKSCSGGLCNSTCTGTNANCNRPAAPAADDGCEVDSATDVNHCGSCTRACSSSGVNVKSCAGGVCNSTCTGTLGNCSQPAAPTADDGCETNTASDPAHCGSCTRPCSAAGVASLSCSGGTCNSTCNSPNGNCNQPMAPTADDGCETNLNTATTHCGSCANDCTSSVQNANGKSCNGSGTCTYTSCLNGYFNCDGDSTNGCEITGNTTAHCGGCGACDSSTSQGATCSGWPSSTTCSYTGCTSGYKDCNTTAPNTPGCETHTDVDANNCGGCGRVCSGTHVSGSPSCSGGTCNSSCGGGFGNCSLPAAPGADDGCESNLTTCYGQACCGTLCGPPPHSNCNAPAGSCSSAQYQLGQTYNDCAPLGTPGNNATYTQAMAIEAAAAATNQPGGGTGDGVWTCGNGANVDTVWCKTATDGSTGICTCWNYNATGTFMPDVGHVYRSTGGAGDKGCWCPTSAAPSWN